MVIKYINKILWETQLPKAPGRSKIMLGPSPVVSKWSLARFTSILWDSMPLKHQWKIMSHIHVWYHDQDIKQNWKCRNSRQKVFLSMFSCIKLWLKKNNKHLISIYNFISSDVSYLKRKLYSFLIKLYLWLKFCLIAK